MDVFEVYAEKLRALASEHNLVSRALRGTEVALDNWKVCDIEVGIVPLDGSDREKIRARFVKHAFVFEYIERVAPYIETIVELYTEEAPSAGRLSTFDRPIGSYKLITSIQGDDVDDFLILD